MSTNVPFPQPATPPPLDSLAHPLTFFLTVEQRSDVLAALRRLHADRGVALRIALRLAPKNAEVRP